MSRDKVRDGHRRPERCVGWCEWGTLVRLSASLPRADGRRLWKRPTLQAGQNRLIDRQ